MLAWAARGAAAAGRGRGQPWPGGRPLPAPGGGRRRLGVVAGAAEALAQAQAAAGAPWWLALAGAAVGVRTALLPVALRQARAGGVLVPLWARCQGVAAKIEAEWDADRRGPLRQTRFDLALEMFGRERRRVGAPHPAWLVAAPLVHIPVLATALMAVRRLTLEGGRGLDAGGALWFPDLTAPALDLAALATPMGPAGAVLPAAACGLYFANVQLSLGRADAGWLLGFRTALEWLAVPLLLAGLQLPHGVLCYWVASNGLTTLQTLGLRTAAARRALGLAPRAEGPDAAAEADAAGADGGAGGEELGRGAGPPGADTSGPSSATAVTLADATAEEVLQRAAELRAAGDVVGAIATLRDATQPGLESFVRHHALGKMYATQRNWPAAAKHFERAAELASRKTGHEKGHALFGAGVAAANAGDRGLALAHLAEAGQLVPKKFEVWVALASLHKNMGNGREAERALARAVKLDPKQGRKFADQLKEAGKGRKGKKRTGEAAGEAGAR